MADFTSRYVNFESVSAPVEITSFSGFLPVPGTIEVSFRGTAELGVDYRVSEPIVSTSTIGAFMNLNLGEAELFTYEIEYLDDGFFEGDETIEVTFKYNESRRIEYINGDLNSPVLVPAGEKTSLWTLTILDDEQPTDNLPPTAGDDFLTGFATHKDEAFSTVSVLTNDIDPDGDSIELIEFDASSAVGDVEYLGSGVFSYDPNGNFDGLEADEFAFDTFTYTISDGELTDTATVTITVIGTSCADLEAELSDLETQVEIAELNIQGLQEQISYVDAGIGWTNAAATWAALPAVGGFLIGAVGGVIGTIGAFGLISVDVYYADGWDDILTTATGEIDNLTDAMAADVDLGRPTFSTRLDLAQAGLRGGLTTLGKVGGELGTVFDFVDVFELRDDFETRAGLLEDELSSWVEELNLLEQDIFDVQSELAACPDETALMVMETDHFDMMV